MKQNEDASVKTFTKNVHETKNQSIDTIIMTATVSAIYCQYLVIKKCYQGLN